MFGIKDERLGEVVGCMVYLKPAAKLSATELVAAATPKLASFKVPLPQNVFFTGEPLLRGATGKIMKREIRAKINDELSKGQHTQTRAKM